MSALVGLYHRDGRPVSHSALTAMLDSLSHRGADAVRMWHGGGVGLGQRLLRTTVESLNETLPLADEEAQLSLVADVRIDNRAELIVALGFDGRPPTKIPDGELILAAYRRWGEECPARLLGDFAFAIWDGRRQTFFCARDHFGVRQLYYHCSPEIFACATEIKALFELKEVPCRLNEPRLAEYLLSLFEDKSATLYEQIYVLPPGHSMTVDRAGAKRRTYWTPDPTREVKYTTDAEYAEAYLEIFIEAVRCRMRSSGPVGSTLSGGLDSSAVACVARDIAAGEGREPLHTFSAVYDEVPECDERQYINAVLAQGGVRPHFGHPDRLGPLTDWQEGLSAVDEPLWNPQMALHWVLYEQARGQGVNVLLDGFGGDFVVSYGVGRLTDLARSGRLFTLFKETASYADRVNRPFWRTLRSHAVVPFMPAPAMRYWHDIRYGRDSFWLKETPLREDFIKRVGLRDRVSTLNGARGGRGRDARARHASGLSAGIYPFALGVADRTTAMFGIERRQPFMDKRLVEFCLALPAEQKLRNGWPRLVARNALANILPLEVQWRAGKADHSPNFHRGLLTADKRTLEALILNGPGRLTEYVDVVRLRAIHRNYMRRPNNRDGGILWRTAVLARWLERAGFGAGANGRSCPSLKSSAPAFDEDRLPPNRQYAKG